MDEIPSINDYFIFEKNQKTVDLPAHSYGFFVLHGLKWKSFYSVLVNILIKLKFSKLIFWIDFASFGLTSSLLKMLIFDQNLMITSFSLYCCLIISCAILTSIFGSNIFWVPVAAAFFSRMVFGFVSDTQARFAPWESWVTVILGAVPVKPRRWRYSCRLYRQ